MNSRFVFRLSNSWLPLVFMLTVVSLSALGCTRKQMKLLLNAGKEEPEEAIAMPEVPVAKPVPAAKPKPAPTSTFYVDPGSGREAPLLGGLRMAPPETFNIIIEQEGNDFRSNWKHFRWERQSGGAWFIVTFLRGMDYEGTRAPKIQDERVVNQRIKVAFARVDKTHRLTSNGSQNEKLAGIDTVRTNVAGKVNGEDAVGHLYLLYDGKHLIEIVALATEPNRDALKHCRAAANSLARGPAKKG